MKFRNWPTVRDIAMPRWIKLSIVFVSRGCFGTSHSSECQAAETPPADAQKFKTLTGQLGAATWAERERATAELLRSGVEALPALSAMLNAPDAEVRTRARIIHAHIDSQDYQQRVREFAADVDGRQQLSLPGWKRFRKQVGDDAVSRKLFVGMATAARPVMESVEQGPAAVGRQLDEELQTIRQLNLGGLRETQGGKAMSAITALVFAAGDSAVPVNAETAAALGSITFCATADAGFAKADQVPALTKIWGGWVGREFSAESITSEMHASRLLAALNYSVPEGLPLALKQATPARSLVRSLAVLTIGKVGAKQNVEDLTPLLTASDNWLADANTGVTMRIGANIQIRDLALAVSAYLSGRNPRDFGFRSPERTAEMFPHFKQPPQYQNQLQNQFQYEVTRVFDLKSPTRREGAFKKWTATLALEKATAAKDQAGFDAAKRDIDAAEQLLLNVKPDTTIPAKDKDE